MRYCRILKGYGGKRDTKNLYKLMWCYESTKKRERQTRMIYEWAHDSAVTQKWQMMQATSGQSMMHHQAINKHSRFLIWIWYEGLCFWMRWVKFHSNKPVMCSVFVTFDKCLEIIIDPQSVKRLIQPRTTVKEFLEPQKPTQFP
jgi:hypothetical protein